MSIHSHARTYQRCAWRWEWEDVALDCDDTAIVGEKFCPEHLIEHSATRTFPPRVIHPNPPPERPTE